METRRRISMKAKQGSLKAAMAGLIQEALDEQEKNSLFLDAWELCAIMTMIIKNGDDPIESLEDGVDYEKAVKESVTDEEIGTMAMAMLYHAAKKADREENKSECDGYVAN